MHIITGSHAKVRSWLGIDQTQYFPAFLCERTYDYGIELATNKTF